MNKQGVEVLFNFLGGGDILELQQRKPNRLKNYDYSQGGSYFITICTQNKLQILSNIVGDGFSVPQLTNKGIIVEKHINEIPLKYTGIKTNKYVIMPNHIHIILDITKNDGTENPSPTVGTIIAWFKYQITKQINLLDNLPENRVFSTLIPRSHHQKRTGISKDMGIHRHKPFEIGGRLFLPRK